MKANNTQLLGIHCLHRPPLHRNHQTSRRPTPRRRRARPHLRQSLPRHARSLSQLRTNRRTLPRYPMATLQRAPRQAPPRRRTRKNKHLFVTAGRSEHAEPPDSREQDGDGGHKRTADDAVDGSFWEEAGVVWGEEYEEGVEWGWVLLGVLVEVRNVCSILAQK
jgi:hypothetical protein